MPHNPRMPSRHNKGRGAPPDNESPRSDTTPTFPVSAPKRRQQKKPSGMPKRKVRDDDDDSDVDSRGNIRGLIDYDYDSSDDAENLETLMREARKYGLRLGHKKPKMTTDAAAPAPPTATKKRIAPTPVAPAPPAPKGRYNLRSRVPVAASPTTTEEEEEEEDTSEEDTESSDEDEEVEEEDDTDEEEDEDYDEDESEEASEEGNSVIRIMIGGGAEESDALVPKRHNMKKEPAAVKRFVELITAPSEDNTIDTQIDQFKSLDEVRQGQILRTLEARPASNDVQNSLMFKILQMRLSPEVQTYVLAKYKTLQAMEPTSGEYFKIRNWLDKVTAMPFGTYKDMPVSLDQGAETCGGFMEKAKKCLDEALYGQVEAKLQILQFIATRIANPDARGLSLLLVGPPGIGKTSLIKGGIAKALEWPFQFVSLGGETEASTYTGHQLVYEGSHAGKIVNSLIAAKSMSMVMMFDEVDKVSSTAKGEEIQNMLIHLTDPVQNSEFEDKYLANIPIDLSKSMFVFSANDINKLDRILLDRMVVVHLKGYEKKDKLQIAENYLLPSALKDVNLMEKVAISKEILEHIIQTHASEEPGVRELKRCIEQIAQKINMLRMFNSKELPFHIPEFTLPFVVKKSHVDIFLKKTKPEGDEPPYGLYV
jgi:hypothetical protein